MAEDTFFGLLNGIAQKLYYENKEITDDVLKNDLYPSVTDQEFSKLLAKATNVIKVRFKSFPPPTIFTCFRLMLRKDAAEPEPSVHNLNHSHYFFESIVELERQARSPQSSVARALVCCSRSSKT